MYETRQPITNENIRGEEMRRMGGIRFAKNPAIPPAGPGKPAGARSIRQAMTQRMLEIGEGCRDKDLLLWFSKDEIEAHGAQASEDAKRMARLN